MSFAPELVINDFSRKHLESFLRSPSHAVILHGNQGIGLTTIAIALAKAISPSQPHIEVAPIDGKDVSIDQVRSLYSATQSVEPSRKVVIVDDAHTMGFDAQNAFLKLLEEPPAHVHFVLVVHDISALLPTIQSRAEVVNIRLVPQTVMQAHIDSLTNDPTMKAQLGFLAGGLPAKAKLLSESPEIMQSSADMTRDARAFLQGEYYDRLIVSGKYTGTRDAAISFVTTVGQLLIHTIRRQSDQAARLDTIAQTIDRLHQNANVKLQLIHLSLGL
jgi:DNA polymerase-3 subunit delta'